jgi:hypothetical protein
MRKIDVVLKLLVVILIGLAVAFLAVGLTRFAYAIPKGDVNTNDILIYRVRVSHLASAIIVMVFSIAGLMGLTAWRVRKSLKRDHENNFEIFAEKYSDGEVSKARNKAMYYKKLYERSEKDRRADKSLYEKRLSVMIASMNLDLTQGGEG